MGSLTMAPGDRRTVRVETAPPAEYRVRFALVGDLLDASLSASEVYTTPNGIAEVDVTVPAQSTSTEFSVRASIGPSTSTDVMVSVSPNVRLTSLVIAPEYRGSRSVAFWYAGVYPGQTCADLLKVGLPPDAELEAEVLAEQTTLTVSGMLTGFPVAVAVRANRFAAGCSDVPELEPDTEKTIKVTVTDLPLRLEEPFDVELHVDTITPSWQEAFAPLVEEVEPRLLSDGTGETSNQISTLLDALQAEVIADGMDEEEFTYRRESGSWDDTVTAQVLAPDAEGDSGSSSLTRRWVQGGLDTLVDGCSLSGQLEPAPSGKDAGEIRFRPSSFAGASSQAAGLASEAIEITWSSDPDDTVKLGGRLEWVPFDLLASLASVGAADDCLRIAQAMVNAGHLGGLESFSGCDVDCTRSYCEAAVRARWQQVRDELQPKQFSLELGATATATVDERAAPQSLLGKWVGIAQRGEEEFVRMNGSFDGSP
ncbi:hypothetical protein ACFL5O_10725 [Myxococcota bacterium]